MDGMVIKYQYRQLKRSKVKTYDFFNLLYSYIARPRNVFISSNVKFKNKGIFKPTSPFYFDILVNRATWASSDEGVLKIAGTGKMITGKNVRISGGCRIAVDGNLEIGDNSFINPRSIIVASTCIKIGNNCAISWNCQLLDTDIHAMVADGRPKERSLPISIGNKVWIGAGCTILKGVTIGDGCVIAAGSVVTGNIPAGTLAAGVPAKAIKENIDWIA
jgi:acetyltransferase-like isoleucine patch superfamily enzyme